MMASVGFAPGFHPEMVPSRVAKMNTACFPGITSKLVPPLKTMPVGWDRLVCPMGGGMVTTSGSGAPAPLNSRDVPPTVVLTHHGLVEERAVPHAPTKLVSVLIALPDTSETRLL